MADEHMEFYFGTSDHGQKVHAITSRSRGIPLCNNAGQVTAEGRFARVPSALRCKMCNEAVTRRAFDGESD